MPIETDSAQLRRYVMSAAADKKLAKEALFLIRPFFYDAIVGAYPLVPSWNVDDDSFAAAIGGVAGVPVGKLTPVSVSKGDGRLAQFLDHQQLTCLPMFIQRAHRSSLGASWGEDRFKEFVYTLYECLGAAMLANLTAGNRKFFDQLDQELVNDLPFIPVVCVFYLLAYAMDGQREMYERFAALVRLLGQAVPIGETKNPGEWLILVG